MSSKALSVAQSVSGPLRIAQYVFFGLLDLSLLYVIYLIYATGEYGIAAASLVLVVVANIIYIKQNNQTLYSYRYMFPGLLTFGMFVIFPLLYTFVIGFSNYSTTNLLTYDRVKHAFLQETYVAGDQKLAFKLYQTGAGDYQLFLTDSADPSKNFVVEGLSLDSTKPQKVAAQPSTGTPAGQELQIKEIVSKRNQIKALQVSLPDNSLVKMTGLREFTQQAQLYKFEGETLINQENGKKYTPNHEIGFFVDETGQKLTPGFRTWIGKTNFMRIFTEPAISEPFIKIFIWTVIWAAGSVFLTLSVGMTLAVVLNWQAIKFRTLYRTLLIIPYAIPAFISILIFRGMFNSEFGEINNILNMIIGFKPAWYEKPFLAKTMLLIVNTWLGYPYMMILSTGILQSIPDTIYEASAIDGASPLDNFFRLTVPLLVKPLIPLLISSFAFNFNNFVIIYLLTGGRPNILGASTPAGETDILVSYTFRLAFGEAEAQYGFASAIATIIFLIVVVLTLINLRLTASKPAKA